MPKKSRTGLFRSYAKALIPDTRPAVKSNDDGYEPDTEQEMALALETEEDDPETPKERKKGAKPKVRDLIEAQHDEFVIQKSQEDMEVSVHIVGISESTSHFLFDQVCDVEPTTCVCCLDVSPFQ